MRISRLNFVVDVMVLLLFYMIRSIYRNEETRGRVGRFVRYDGCTLARDDACIDACIGKARERYHGTNIT
jgi:hypothetical protein